MNDLNNKNSSSRRRTATNSGTTKKGSAVHKNYSYHNTGGHHSGGGHRRKKSDLDITQILMYGMGALIIILCIVLAVKGCGKIAGKGKESTEISETDLSAEELGNQVTVDGINITGMTQEQAKTAILKQYDWNMKVTYKDKEATVSNLMEAKVDELLEEIYAGENKTSYEIKTDNMLEAAKAEASLISGNWDMVAKKGGISGYDKKTGKFTFTQGTNGVVIDQDKLAEDIVASITKKDYQAVVEAQVKEVSTDMSAAQLKDKYKTIGTYTTKTTSNKDRNENIRLASNALNGIIVNPGQEFSFNNATGARSPEKGYKPAGAYLNGEVVQEPGGGVCQVSSTLYNAVVFAGLTSTERHAHSYEPSYVTPGEDATVSFGGPDFKFVNNSEYPIAIKTGFASQELTISIYGVQIVKDGVKIRMASEKTGDIDAPTPVYEEDPTLQLDETKTAKEAKLGSRWSTYLVTYQDGKEVSRELFHNSSYRGKPATIKRNTSGVVTTTPAVTETGSVDPSASETQPTTENSGSAGPAGPAQESKPSQAPTAPSQPTTQLSPGGMTETQVGPITETSRAVPAPGVVAPGQNPTAVEPGPMAPTAN
ncbi:MAG: VanW family protein [Clostridium sp.]